MRAPKMMGLFPWPALLLVCLLSGCGLGVAFARVQRPNAAASKQLLQLSAGEVGEASGQLRRKLPANRHSILSKISFGWVTELMELGNRKTLQIEDMWAFEEADRVSNLSDTFSQFFEAEKSQSSNNTSSRFNKNLILDFWQSSVCRAIVKMYKKPLVQSGVLKFFNTLVQFLPSLIIARLLGGIDLVRLEGATGKAAMRGVFLALSLFAALSAKTFLENQYFFTVIDMGASIRGTLSAAIYRKALKLSPSGRNNNTVGEIVNFMQIDTNRMEQVAGTIHVVWDGIFQIVGYTSLLLYFLGPSVFAGIAAMLVIVPLNAVFLKQLSTLRLEILKHTDARVKLTNEVLQGVRAIKSYNWEKPFLQQLTNIRDKELRALKLAANTRAVLVAMLSAAPSFVAVLSLGTYALLGNALTPTKVFTALGLFNQLRFPLTFFPLLLNTLAEGKISLNRLTTFLTANELQNYVQVRNASSSDVAVSVENATFSWSDLGGAIDNSTALRRGKLANVNFSVKRGDLVAIVGPVGSGKSTLMSAILGELNKEKGDVSVAGKVAFVSQSAWIPNDSLQNVVLFGNKMDAARYAETLEVCALSRDIELLDAGDQTEIGERGVNLSGGQKQRVSIARAVYDDADVYLFDDPLSALDSQVGAKVFKACIKGKLKSKTRILATNELSILPEVDRIILLAKSTDDDSCKIVDQGTFTALLSRGHDLSKIVQKRPDPATSASAVGLTGAGSPPEAVHVAAKAKETVVEPMLRNTDLLTGKLAPAVKLMTVEERGEGVVGLDVYKSYLNSAKNPALLGLVVASFVMANVCQQFQQWVVASWTADAGYVKLPLQAYLFGITSMAAGVAFFNWFRTYLSYILGAEASQTIHFNMAKKVLAAPLSFFESTPVGRLIQRFTKDLDQVDQQLPGSFGQLIASTLSILASMVAIIVVTPSFGLVLGPIIFVYIAITNYYRGVARELKRLDSLSRSPVFAHFSETIGGLSTIRSFARQDMVRLKNEVRLEDNLAAYNSLKLVDRWLSVRLELLGNVIVFVSALLAVWSGSRAGPAGLSLNNALSTTSLLNWAVRNGAETESLMNSVERVMYTTSNTPSEAASISSLVPNVEPLVSNPGLQPKNDTELLGSGWPWQGGVTFSNGVMRYREDFQPVLQGVNVAINPGESIGIVGRTGSGKSSLFRALLRLTELEHGNILIDGVDIRSIGLDTLRSSIAIIPQDPVLFSGSIRLNLDPFNTKDDAVLWEALRRANLDSSIRSLPGGLDFQLSESGENFSQGQRQLMCLARALIRRSKIVLLDEATSSVDYRTDAIIQTTLRDEFGRGKSTILVVAHRLSTIMDTDRVLVMSDGRVVEFDSPERLLRNPDSYFARLVAAEEMGSVPKTIEASSAV